jgi:hypothetical protein
MIDVTQTAPGMSALGGMPGMQTGLYPNPQQLGQPTTGRFLPFDVGQQWANPATGFGQPQFGQQQFGQPQFGQPQFGQPQFGQPQFGQQQFGQPQFGQPQFGQPQFGQPQFGQPQFGQPQFGQSQFGQPQFGQQQFGQPQFGQSQFGYPQLTGAIASALIPVATPYGVQLIPHAWLGSPLGGFGQQGMGSPLGQSAPQLFGASGAQAGGMTSLQAQPIVYIPVPLPVAQRMSAYV